MTYEIKNACLFDLFRNRPCRSPRRRDSAIVWPSRPADVPEIPFNPYNPEHVRKWWAGEMVKLQERVFGDADGTNKRAEDYLNRQWKDPYEDAYIPEGLTRGKSEFDGLRDVVQPPVMPPRGNGWQADTDGEREALGRHEAHRRVVDRWEARQAAKARWKACECEECRDWGHRKGCLDRQRAGKCPTFKRRDSRSDSGRDASAGG